MKSSQTIFVNQLKGWNEISFISDVPLPYKKDHVLQDFFLKKDQCIHEDMILILLSISIRDGETLSELAISSGHCDQ